MSSTSATGAASAVIVGQGAAGLTAALVLAREGIRVISLAKVRPGAATCTAYAGGGFTLGIGGVSTAEHKQMTLETGRHLNVPELLDTFSDEAPTIVEFMRSAGVPFRTGRGGLSITRDMAFPLLGGKPLNDALAKACLEAGVEFRADLVAVRLLPGERGITGVECIDHVRGEAVTIAADAVVLATGGAGALYARTDNPARITGDGYRLALDAGCHLMDMEFVQFYPIGFDLPGGASWFMGLEVIDHARVTGADGREFLKEMLAREGIFKGRDANLLARDKCSVAIARENGRGQALLHLEDIPAEIWQTSTHYRNIARMFPKTAPAGSAPVPLHPVEHYFPGGVVIGTNGETELPGLFACGEVTGGVDGANRVGGNALTNCILFGQRAALAAARFARGESVATAKLPAGLSGETSARVEMPAPATAAEWLAGWRRNSEADAAVAITPADLRKRLQAFSSQCLLPVRFGDRLAAAPDALADLREMLPRQAVTDQRDLLLASENLGLWHTAALVATGALIREESRGAHFRDDYPAEDAAWMKHIWLRSRSGALMAAQG